MRPCLKKKIKKQECSHWYHEENMLCESSSINQIKTTNHNFSRNISSSCDELSYPSEHIGTLFLPIIKLQAD